MRRLLVIIFMCIAMGHRGECDFGSAITARSGQLTSPFHPSDYENDMDVTWSITTDVDDTLLIEFTAMDMEPNAACRYDYVRLYDGDSANATVLGSFCGDTLPPPTQTTSNQVYVAFHTDYSVTGSGFVLEWRSVPPILSPTTDETASTPSECDCDRVGSTAELCDDLDGTCMCKEGFGGPRCDRCQYGHYNYPLCTMCDCNALGSESETCNENGQCRCRPGYSDLHCDTCAIGFYNYPECTPCECDIWGSYGVRCEDQSGQCMCKPAFEGRTCQSYRANYYNNNGY